MNVNEKAMLWLKFSTQMAFALSQKGVCPYKQNPFLVELHLELHSLATAKNFVLLV